MNKAQERKMKKKVDIGTTEWKINKRETMKGNEK